MNVSVIIPVYNAERFIRQSVESALAQPETFEVILVEDGSSDNSLKVCTDIALQNSKARVLRHEGGQNRGASASRNLGIKSALSEYVAFLDADDWYLFDRFSNAKRRFSENIEIDGVYDAVGVYFENEAVQKEWFKRNNFELTTLTQRVTPDGVFEALLSGDKGYIHLNGLVLSKRVFKKTNLFYEHIRLGEDSAFCIQIAATTQLVSGSLTKPVAIRRLHGDNSIFGPMWRDRRRQIVLMWQTLFDWAIDIKLHCSQIDLLADCYLSAAERGRGDNRIIARGLLRWKILVEVIRKHPQALKQKHYWYHVIRACDLTKLRYFVTGVP